MGESRFNPNARALDAALKDRSTIILKDRLGRVLQLGDLVQIEAPLKQLLWKITAVVPVVDPRQPPNLLAVQFSVSMTMAVQRTGQPVADILRVAEAAELSPAPAVEVTDPDRPPDPVTES